MSLLAAGVQRVLITGGAGFIGGALIRRLLVESDVEVYNLDKLGYASDLASIGGHPRHHLLQVDLADAAATLAAVQNADPDLVMHLAAESHVDRSIDGPSVFIGSNVNGTFHLLEAVRSHWQTLPTERRERFRFHHISTDEVFGSLGVEGFFSEMSPYDPRSPYSASKAASDHLVRAWHHTYGLPVLLTNCSNNFGPWQFPEKLIPVVVLKALAGEPIPLYGDGGNVRDWLFVEDHVDALLLVASRGCVGDCYCVGGHGERSNSEIVQAICSILDDSFPQQAPHARLIQSVADRPGHDRRYAINPAKIQQELGWKPRHQFEQALALTVNWYISNRQWCEQVRERVGYSGTRLGLDCSVKSST
jgi:dTDP-glucose 4,6-dehydratase